VSREGFYPPRRKPPLWGFIYRLHPYDDCVDQSPTNRYSLARVLGREGGCSTRSFAAAT
jgi:hypothetical protein